MARSMHARAACPEATPRIIHAAPHRDMLFQPSIGMACAAQGGLRSGRGYADSPDGSGHGASGTDAFDTAQSSASEGNASSNGTLEPSDPLDLGHLDEDIHYAQFSKVSVGLQGNKRLSRAEKRARKMELKGVHRKLHHYRVPIPPEVKLTVIGTRMFFEGPLGSNAVDLLKVDPEGMAAMKLERDGADKITDVLFAGPRKDITRSCRTHVQSRVNGVVRGYLVYLQLVGVGYRVSKGSKDVTYTVSNG